METNLEQAANLIHDNNMVTKSEIRKTGSPRKLTEWF